MNVKFCKIKKENLEMIRNWRNSPEISKYMYTNDYITKDHQKKWFQRIKDDATRKYWIIKVDDNYVGVVNLYNIDMRNKRCYWAYYLAHPSVRGKGIGRLIELNILNYVFEVLFLNKLCCEVFTFNELVIKIHQKYGSKIEGNFRKHIYKDNRFHDIVCMGILKEEWNDLKDNFNFEIIKFE